MRLPVRWLTCPVALALALGLSVVAAGAPAGEAKPPPAAPGAGMDFGSLMTYFVALPGTPKTVVGKAVVVRLAGGLNACYDQETLRLVGVWRDGYLDFSTTCIARIVQGTGPAPVTGTVLINSGIGPGWAKGGSFADPRAQGLGGLPAAWASYRGLYRHGEQAVLAFTVGDCEVRELPGAIGDGAGAVMTRTLRLGRSSSEQRLLVCEVAGATRADGSTATLAVLSQSSGLGAEGRTAVGVSGAPAGVVLSVADGRAVLTIPAHAQPLTLTVGLWAGAAAEVGVATKAIAALAAPADVDALCAGGPSRWGPALTLAGTLGRDDTAYTVDTVPLPVDNHWKSWMRPTGVDFFRDGRAAVATFSGDVWIAGGLDAGLQQVTWRRFAAGLFEPLGLRIIDDVVYVMGRDQLTRLTDLDHDGEADFYESFNHDVVSWPVYNNYTFDLASDRAGNLYYAKGGHNSPHGLPLHSAICKVAKDGHATDIIATGLRQPNGLGMGPNDELTFSDNEGHWIPASKISLVKPGNWYGYVGDPAVNKGKTIDHPAEFAQPLCWIPMAMDNSSGAQVWAPAGDRWGPLGGALLHTSFGKSALMLVLHESVGGVAQGGVLKLPLTFASGIMRGRFSPADGQLYVCGLKGWQSNAGSDGCLQRVRFTGKPVCLPSALHVTRSGLTIGFTAPLDPSSAVADNLALERWNYVWSASYGSPEMSVADPKRKGRDKFEATAVKLSADKRTLTIDLPESVPCMQLGITLKLRAADGAEVNHTIYATVNAVPK
jgi:glucose/arabinose dehydrogenase